MQDSYRKSLVVCDLLLPKRSELDRGGIHSRLTISLLPNNPAGSPKEVT